MKLSPPARCNFQLLSLRATRGAKCADVRERAEVKIRDIEEKIRSLRTMGKALRKLVAECSGGAPVTDCVILDALERKR